MASLTGPGLTDPHDCYDDTVNVGSRGHRQVRPAGGAAADRARRRRDRGVEPIRRNRLARNNGRVTKPSPAAAPSTRSICSPPGCPHPIKAPKMTPQTPAQAASVAASGTPLLPGTVLAAALLTTGLMAGVFGLYTHTIMPGLRHTDDRTFIGAFQATDKAILNPWFLAAFFGALVLTGLAAALHLAGDRRHLLPWIGAAFVLYLIAVVITMAVNVPLNDALKAAGDPARI